MGGRMVVMWGDDGCSIDNTANIIFFSFLIRLHIQRQLILIAPQ